MFEVVVDGEEAGQLWIGPRTPDDYDHWWVWDIEIDEAWRGRGVGRAAMELIERGSRAHGAIEIGLSVTAENSTRDTCTSRSVIARSPSGCASRSDLQASIGPEQD